MLPGEAHQFVGAQIVTPKIDAYINRSQKWPDEMTALRTVLVGCGLTEEMKWGKPCYSHDGKNIVILQEMKVTCGVVLHDSARSSAGGALRSSAAAHVG